MANATPTVTVKTPYCRAFRFSPLILSRLIIGQEEVGFHSEPCERAGGKDHGEAE
jgi:hypothetical protein